VSNKGLALWIGTGFGVGIAVAVLLAALTFAPPEAGADPKRVVVRLPTNESGLSISAQGAISVQQRRLEAALASYPFVISHKYATIPFMAIETTQEALDSLVPLGVAVSIQDDIEFEPSLINSGPVIGLLITHAAGHKGAGIAIAILDTGVSSSHLFFSGRVVEEACFAGTPGSCPNGEPTQTGPGSAAPCDSAGCRHGTHVAGDAAGETFLVNRGSGVAPAADIIAIQVFRVNPDTGRVSASFSDLLAAMEHVLFLTDAHNIAAVNMSLGTGPRSSPCDGSFEAFKMATDNLNGVGVAVVAAAGNSGSTTGISSPACISNIVAVGCTGNDDSVCRFSNSHSTMDIWAPGLSISSSVPSASNDLFSNLSGTSMSAPHVAGAFAVVRAAFPLDTPAELLARLTSTGKPVLDKRNDVLKPRLQLAAALGLIAVPPGTCGDGALNNPDEECDRSDDAACPGLCLDNCFCCGSSNCPDCPGCPDCPQCPDIPECPGCDQCTVDADCLDDLLCNGRESCVNGVCVPGNGPPCPSIAVCREAPNPGCIPCWNFFDCVDNTGQCIPGEECPECPPNECPQCPDCPGCPDCPPMP